MKKNVLLSVPFLTLLAVSALAAETPSTKSIPAIKPAVIREHSMMKMMGADDVQNSALISGTVLETMNNGGYSYIYLQKKNGDKVWVAVTEIPVKVGSLMNVKPGMVMTDFESKGLKRTFASIIFSDGPLETKPNSVATPAKNSPGDKGHAAAKEQKISVVKATGPNAITVAEAFKNSAKLDKKNVVVRGQVVKVSVNIMKKNWIHIQDGTGSKNKRTDTLVCTSLDMMGVGDVVTVSGILAKDRDFGSGYHYTTIVENAKLKK